MALEKITVYLTDKNKETVNREAEKVGLNRSAFFNLLISQSFNDEQRKHN